MKKLILLTAILSIITLGITAQKVENSTGKASKTLKSNFYFSTLQLQNGNVAVIYGGKKPEVHEFDKNGKFIEIRTGLDDVLSAIPQAESSTYDNFVNAYNVKKGYGLNVMYPSTTAVGALTLDYGVLSLDEREEGKVSFVYGFKTTKDKSSKLKINDTWKTEYHGARTITQSNRNPYVFTSNSGISRSYWLGGGMTTVDGATQIAGVINEKVSTSSPSPYNRNRLISFKISYGEDSISHTIHEMKHPMQKINVSADAQNNMIVLTMPVAAPSTVKEQNALNAEGTEKTNLYLYRFDADNKFVDEHELSPGLSNVDYQVFAVGNKSFIIGTGEAGSKPDKYRWNGTASKVDAFLITEIAKDGTVAPFKQYAAKDFTNKLVLNGVKKLAGIKFYQAETLANGGAFLFGWAASQVNVGALISPQGELLKLYAFPYMDLKKNRIALQQIHAEGDKIYVILAEQPIALSNQVEKEGTRLTGTHTHQMIAMYHLSNIFIIDGKDGQQTNHINLSKSVKDFYTLGDTPALFTKDGVFIPGRIKANDGNKITMVKLPY
ncbi:MAG: hypothetical protein BGO29_08815 [Bacteroidales bacterium 36-12]|nr:MAG: hypothetical protein BGO29_08815 [Bacteroidales bacterium 36-12]